VCSYIPVGAFVECFVLVLFVDVGGERVLSFERVVIDVVSVDGMSSAACAAADVICLISFSNVSVSVFGAMDLRLRDVARRVEGGGGESPVGFEDEVGVAWLGVVGARREVGVAVEGGLVEPSGGGNGRGWWRVETIIDDALYCATLVLSCLRDLFNWGSSCFAARREDGA